MQLPESSPGWERFCTHGASFLAEKAVFLYMDPSLGLKKEN